MLVINMSDQNAIDMKDFRKKMLENFPFLPKQFLDVDPTQGASWVSDYVQKQLQRAFSNTTIEFPFTSKLNYDVAETHRNIILRLHVPKDISPHDIKMSLDTHLVRIELPSGDKQDITIKKPVNPKRAAARYKNGILELQMPKMRYKRRLHEVIVEDA
jgi:HSP20 family molecular chaperone IbpA